MLNCVPFAHRGGFQLPLRHAEQLFTMKNIQDQKMQIMESQPRLLIVFNDITSLISVRVCLKEKQQGNTFTHLSHSH